MIEVICHTNLDLSWEKWPDELPAVPRVGDRIASATVHSPGGRGKFQLELEVASVTWKPRTRPGKPEMWIPHIELHTTSLQRQLPSKHRDACTGSITAFYEWYAPLVGRSVGSFI
jgi:hypothetical protein